MPTTTYKQGETYTDANGRTGNVNFDAATGRKLKSGESSDINAVAVAGDPNTSINSGNLSGGKVTLPTGKTAAGAGTETAGLGGMIESDNTTIKTRDQKERDDAKANLDTGVSDITTLINDLGKEGQLKDDAYKTNGTDEFKKKSDQYSADLDAEALALRRKTDALDQANPEGLFGAAASDEKARLARESTSKQADIAILQQAALNNYTRMKDIADRQVAAILEPKKAALEAKKFLYENNKDLFDKADAKIIADEQREYDRQETELNKIKDLKLALAKNNAPASVLALLTSAKSIDDVITNPLVAQYMTSPADKLDLQLKRLQIAKANNELTGKGSNELLSIDEATKLGVPYGTTQAQAIALQGKAKPLDDTQQTILTSAIDLKTKLENFGKDTIGVGGALPVGAGSIGFSVRGSNRRVFINQYDNLTNLLQLNAAKLIKGQGALSDSERDILKKASTTLNRTEQSPEEFTKSLNDIIDVIQRQDPNYQYASAAAGLGEDDQADGTESAGSYASGLLKSFK